MSPIPGTLRAVHKFVALPPCRCTRPSCDVPLTRRFARLVTSLSLVCLFALPPLSFPLLRDAMPPVAVTDSTGSSFYFIFRMFVTRFVLRVEPPGIGVDPVCVRPAAAAAVLAVVGQGVQAFQGHCGERWCVRTVRVHAYGELNSQVYCLLVHYNLRVFLSFFAGRGTLV